MKYRVFNTIENRYVTDEKNGYLSQMVDLQLMSMETKMIILIML